MMFPRRGQSAPIDPALMQRNYERARTALVAVAVLMLGVALGYLVVIATGIAQVQAETTKRGQEIQSCTTPGGACYERSQKQTGAAVGSINQVTILAVACARQPGNDTEAEVKACVEKGLRP